MSDFIKSILSLQRDEYVANRDTWERNEMRFKASKEAYGELWPFQWEQSASLARQQDSRSAVTESALATLEQRRDAAVIVEFGGMVAERFGGLLFQHFPVEESGMDLGNLRSADGGVRAEILLRDADGTGPGARSLEAFWRDAYTHTLPTNVRWIFVESPTEAAATLADVRDGKHPYFVEYSPLQVPYWEFNSGHLDCLRIEYEASMLVIESGRVVPKKEKRHYLMTREGYEGWGKDEEAPGFRFHEGGWWIVDDKGEIVEESGGEMKGDWQATGGEIPMSLLFYERGKIGSSRSAMEAIGRIQVAFMNLLSALVYDAWSGGSGTVLFLGADTDQWEVLQQAGVSGWKWAPVPPKISDTGVPANVVPFPLAAFDASPAIEKSLDRLMAMATNLILRELTTAPEASGASRRLEFLQGNTPRLVDNAINMEESMRNALRYYEMRSGFADPKSSVDWPRSFDLRTTVQKIKEIFELIALVSGKSKTMVRELMIAALDSAAVIKSGEEGERLRADIMRELEAEEPGGQPTGDGVANDDPDLEGSLAALRARLPGANNTEEA